jgi:hypothetical protein
MADPNWDSGTTVVVLAQPTNGFWTKVLDYVDSSKRLKFVVDDKVEGPPAEGGKPSEKNNKWFYANQKECTADGDPAAGVNAANCLVPDAPVGALIAKIGGSTAGKSDGAKLFVVGSFCTFDLDDKTKGALYLTMNADPMTLTGRSGQLSVKIFRSN